MRHFVYLIGLALIVMLGTTAVLSVASALWWDASNHLVLTVGVIFSLNALLISGIRRPWASMTGAGIDGRVGRYLLCAAAGQALCLLLLFPIGWAVASIFYGQGVPDLLIVSIIILAVAVIGMPYVIAEWLMRQTSHN